jgi:hypothetical protein
MRAPIIQILKWCQDNIIFDTPLDEERYKKVIYQCALEQDLSLFQAGDQTEVGEKGAHCLGRDVFF